MFRLDRDALCELSELMRKTVFFKRILGEVWREMREIQCWQLGQQQVKNAGPKTQEICRGRLRSPFPGSGDLYGIGPASRGIFVLYGDDRRCASAHSSSLHPLRTEIFLRR